MPSSTKILLATSRKESGHAASHGTRRPGISTRFERASGGRTKEAHHAHVIRRIREVADNVPIVICSLTVAELAHGIYRADAPERSRMRRKFLDKLKAHIPVQPVSESTGGSVARIGAEQAAKGVTVPLADLIIGACALELDYAVATVNVRDFNRIPGLNIIQL
jgi:tRNA(fMet)-specific endonuclease VapC